MIIDFRYHVATLAAVFLALGLGIFIGTAMIGNDVLVKEQQRLIDRLENDFNTIRSEKRLLSDDVANLQAEIDKDKNFEKAVLPTIVKDRLLGKKIAIVATTDVQDAQLIEKITNTIKQAGATVTSSTRLLHSLDISDAKKKRQVVAAFDMSKPEADGEVVSSLAKELASDIATGTNLALPSLSSLKLVHASGQYDLPVDAVVILAGRSEAVKDNSTDLESVLSSSFKDMGVTVVGTETSTASFSQIKSFQSNQVSTVDNIESIPGLVSLVVSLQGASGNFGVKETAKQLVPDLSLWPQTRNE